MQDGHPTDEHLLRDHIAHRDEAAFALLVQRHLNLVFGTALRILGDRTAAEEVSQNVFISLARKAATIRTGTGLAGWLHRAALLEARLRQRTDLRRLSREDHAAQLGTTMPTPESPDPLPFEILECLSYLFINNFASGDIDDRTEHPIFCYQYSRDPKS